MARRDLDEWLFQVGAELQRLSEEVSPTAPRVARWRAWKPQIDLMEAENHFILKAEVAGLRGEDFRIAYNPERHSISLRGCRHEEEFIEEGRGGCHQLEIYYGEFEREVQLPETPVNSQEIRAQYRNGFLIVLIPKSKRESDSVTVRRTITVRKV